MSEIELKLELRPNDLDRLLTADLFGEASETVSQHSTYFDTPENRLFSSGFSLRIRQAGDRRVQTVKATGVSASIFARSEWETEVPGNRPVLDHTSPLLNEFGDEARDVVPRFEVVNQRRIWNVAENGSKIEVALDEGRVRAGDREAPFTELELELKDGNQRDLFILARKVEGIVPIRFGVVAKAERGFRLLEASRSVFKAEPVELERGTSAVEAFRGIVLSCFRQFRLNEDILRSSLNPESLHQARVALRRLRSAITLFKTMLQDGEAKRISGEFRWLAGVLGEARNIDVLLVKAKAGQLRDDLVGRRAVAYEEVVTAVDCH